jgi:hypothetical protein
MALASLASSSRSGMLSCKQAERKTCVTGRRQAGARCASPNDGALVEYYVLPLLFPAKVVADSDQLHQTPTTQSADLE